ncbi:hypothetical protein D3C72_1396520 [compost metagenome]
MVPADQLPLAVEGRSQAMVKDRPVISRMHVVFTEPYQLDRCAPVDGLDDISRLKDIV